MSFTTVTKTIADGATLLGEGLDAINAAVNNPIVAESDAIVKVVAAILSALAGHSDGTLTPDEAKAKISELRASFQADQGAARAIANAKPDA